MLENRQQAAMITATRLGAWGDGKSVSKVVESLNGGSNQ